jgi:signal transduction histidine kinase
MELVNPNSALASGGIKILIVDDREDNLMSIETILDRENYEIIKATSGKAALKILLARHDFTLILMDVQMPDMNGFETANLIYQRDKLKHIPIIFITAHNYNDNHLFEGHKVGAIDYIYKPINPDLLRLKVGVFAEMYHKNHRLQMQERELKRVNANLEKEIEERRLSEEKVRLLNRQLIENNANLKTTIEELDRFAYVASHDLQEPLRKIMVFSDRLMTAPDSPIPEKAVVSLEKIVKASQRMKDLINDLLTFSRSTVSQDAFSEVSLSEVVAGVLSDMEIEIEQSGAQVQVDALPKVWAISSQMRQLFQNLVSNALKFKRPDKTPHIHVRYEAAVSSALLKGELVHRIAVADNGIGFEEKHAEDIFVVFKRLHSYHEYQGTGVGLSICKKIMDRHRGSISAKSKLDEGTVFNIEIPVAKGRDKAAEIKFNQLFLEE